MNIVLRTLTSTFTAALVPALLFAAFFSIASHQFDRTSLLIFFVSWAVGAVHIALLGFPIFLLLKKRNLLHFLPIAISGFLVGFIPSAVYAWPHSFDKGNFLFGVFGIVSALVFWRAWLQDGEQNLEA